MSEPIDIPHDCMGQWSQSVRRCPNCQDKYMHSVRIDEAKKTNVLDFNARHFECAACGHWERK